MTIYRQKQLKFILAPLILAFLLICGASWAFQEHPAPWSFAVISDTQGNNSIKNSKSCINKTVVQAIAGDIVRENPDFVLVAGDLVNGWFRNGGTDYATQYANWKEAMRPVYKAGIRVYPIRGNHDSGPERLALPPLPSHLEPPPGTPILLKKAFKDAFPETYIPKNGPVDEKGLTYSFVHKNVFVVGLDQYTGGQHKINQKWLDMQLAGNKAPHIFIYGHEPAFETDHKDNLAFYPGDRDLFWNSIGRAGGRIYFCGHDHFYNRALISDNYGNQIQQIIAGTGGGRLRRWSGAYKDEQRVQGEYHNGDHHGYILVTVEGMKVTVAWRAIVQENNTTSWRILDSISYVLPDVRPYRW
jgi:hypothetical protein